MSIEGDHTNSAAGHAFKTAKAKPKVKSKPKAKGKTKEKVQTVVSLTWTLDVCVIFLMLSMYCVIFTTLCDILNMDANCGLWVK